MHIDKVLLKQAMDELEKISVCRELPKYAQLPDLELYMDQVISIVDKYLPQDITVNAKEKILTPTMVNNYVKLSIIPPPRKKRYTRVHLAYLIIVCTLKQTLAMATIQRIIPTDATEEDVEEIYNSFVNNQRKAFSYVTENIRTVADPIIENEGDNQARLNDLLLQIASAANVFKILTDKITVSTKEQTTQAGQ